MIPNKVTVTEVAQLAGVSISTVSMVLNGKGRISKSTTQKVNQAIEQLNYVPNHAASTLRGQQAKVIGLILRDMTHPFYMEVASGLSDAIEQAGYMLFISQTRGQPEQFKRCVMALQQQQVSGIVFSPMNSGQETSLALISNIGIASLCISRASLPMDIDLACPDNSMGTTIVTETLVSQGHRHIAYIGGHSSSLTRAERLAGYCSALMRCNLPFNPKWIIETDGSQQAAIVAIQQLLIQQPKITAILCHDTTTALGVAYGLKNVGRSIGQDIYIGQQVSLAILEYSTGIELIDSEFILLKHASLELGRQAGNRILQRIKQAELPAQRIMLKPEITKTEFDPQKAGS